MNLPAKDSMPRDKPDSWEIHYWLDSNLTNQPKCETFSTREEARARREEIMASGHYTHVRLFPTTQ
jgi:hypothetical protein